MPKGRNREVSYHTLSYICGLAGTLRPKEPLTVGEWANRHMVLPRGSNEEGSFSTENAPYQAAILDAVADPEVVDVSVMSLSLLHN